MSCGSGCEGGDSSSVDTMRVMSQAVRRASEAVRKAINVVSLGSL